MSFYIFIISACFAINIISIVVTLKLRQFMKITFPPMQGTQRRRLRISQHRMVTFVLVIYRLNVIVVLISKSS